MLECPSSSSSEPSSSYCCVVSEIGVCGVGESPFWEGDAVPDSSRRDLDPLGARPGPRLRGCAS